MGVRDLPIVARVIMSAAPLALPRVEVLSKTNMSLTAYSEYGYVYYSWTEVDVVASPCTIKGLQPNTCYVAKARHWNDESNGWSEYGPISQYMRTFSEEEETKRSSTYYEHALKLEKEQRQEMQHQIEKLQRMLTDPGSKKRQPTPQENLMESRMDVEATITKLKSEIKVQALSMESLEKMRRMDEQVITDLLAEQEKLRQLQTQQAPHEQQEIERLKAMLDANEAKLKHQDQISTKQGQIQAFEASLASKQTEIARREGEVERLMDDCRRMMQEHADVAHCKQLELEDALLDAKQSLEKQLENNNLMHDEMQRLRHENAALKQSIEEFDSKIAPKLVHLEEENAELKLRLGRA
ncbi:hypothetical protein DYB30_009755 [Aphanomyces astaci]|uniref:Uncharacterized protein n=1 Tax=Aphanomyces astaci TaxID=112090 RepID=A0A397DVA5_APHAT|nr:hypothetical protein DYB36_004039 [Aphanomyces astaci]RHY54059.1 hypothetical protein DYB38_009334 [Aphanomyces astaci]RHY71825.1 hypothetical protein DYB30_009755 [Aphanomyces astaci]RHY74702.1 hypothetical protein DYB34_006449 [Aphanomyces astaci]RHZ06773.1 hypothetical protein DYB31_004146 [Aphanomyces astaci]